MGHILCGLCCLRFSRYKMKILFITVFSLLLTGVVCAEGEPIIITEVQGNHDSIVTGVVGDEALNLYTRRDSRRDSMTIGTVGDQVILIDHLPSRFNVRLHIDIEPDLILIEDIGNPLQDRRD